MRYALVAAASVVALAMATTTVVSAQELTGDVTTSTVTGFNDTETNLDTETNTDNSINDSYNPEDNSDNSVDTEDSFNFTDESDNSDNSDNSVRTDTDNSINDSYNDSSTHRTSLSVQTLSGSVTGTTVSFAAPTTGDQNGAFTTGDIVHDGESFSGSAGVHVTGSNTGFAANVQSAAGISANADITFGSP